MKERRKASRVEIEIDVTVDRIDKNHICKAKIKNISACGACFVTDYDLPLSTYINLIFYLPDSCKVMGITGEIVWNEYSTQDDFFFCGIEFIKIPRRFKKMIQQYIDNELFDIRKKEIPFF